MLRSEKPFSSGSSFVKSRASRGMTAAPQPSCCCRAVDNATDIPIKLDQFGIDRQHGPRLSLLNTVLDLLQEDREISRSQSLSRDTHDTSPRLSRNPLPSNIAGIAFSIRAVRVADCLAAAKWYR